MLKRFFPRARDARESRASRAIRVRPSHTPGRFGVRACKISHIAPSPVVRSVTVGVTVVCALLSSAAHNRADVMNKENLTANQP